jgi:hypothetical protein
MRYQRKPNIVEAKRWLGSIESAEEIKAWAPAGSVLHQDRGRMNSGLGYLAVITLNGLTVADPGDWIIWNRDGRLGDVYPCKHDVFVAGYAEAGQEPLVVRWFDQFIDELERECEREALIGALRTGRRLATGELLEW